MDNKVFNPEEHMIDLKGKDYLEVKWRLVWFRSEHPLYAINTEVLELDENHAIFRATVADENGRQISCGTGSESIKDFREFIEKAETKAIGRALAVMGYGTQFAPELEEGDRIVDAPVDRKKQTKYTAPAKKPQTAVVHRGKHDVIYAAPAAQEPPVELPFDDSIPKPKAMATADQIEFIVNNSDDQTYENALAAFGPDLEKMTYKLAEKLIARIKEVNPDAPSV